MGKHGMSRVVSFVVLAAILAVIATLFYRVMAGFLLPLFLAVVLVIMFRPLHGWYLTRCGKRTRLAAGLTTLTILLIVLAPSALLVSRATAEMVAMASLFDTAAAHRKVEKLRQRLGLAQPPEAVRTLLDEIGRTLREWKTEAPQREAGARAEGLAEKSQALQELLRQRQDVSPAVRAACQSAVEELEQALQALAAAEPNEPGWSHALSQALTAHEELESRVLGGTLLRWLRAQANPTAEERGNLWERVQAWLGPLALRTPRVVGGWLVALLLGGIVMIVALYYFLADGPAMLEAVMNLVPLDRHYQAQLLEQFDTVSRAVVVATLLAALVQGGLAGIGYYVAGFQSVFFLTMLTALCALIPFVGAPAVYVSCAAWLLLVEERLWPAVGLLLYGMAVVSSSDNVVKPWVLKGRSNLHPLLALLSVLGGVKSLGPIGILVGPLAVSLLQVLLVMLRTELATMGEQRPSAGATGEPAAAPAGSSGPSAQAR
jgi:predicted PurR-regulated permease PerM